MAVRPYDPVGAMGGLFAPALIRGNRESEEAFERWLEANRRPPPTADAPPAPPAPTMEGTPPESAEEASARQRDAITRTIMMLQGGDQGGSGIDTTAPLDPNLDTNPHTGPPSLSASPTPPPIDVDNTPPGAPPSQTQAPPSQTQAPPTQTQAPPQELQVEQTNPVVTNVTPVQRGFTVEQDQMTEQDVGKGDRLSPTPQAMPTAQEMQLATQVQLALDPSLGGKLGGPQSQVQSERDVAAQYGAPSPVAPVSAPQAPAPPGVGRGSTSMEQALQDALQGIAIAGINVAQANPVTGQYGPDIGMTSTHGKGEPGMNSPIGPTAMSTMGTAMGQNLGAPMAGVSGVTGVSQATTGVPGLGMFGIDVTPMSTTLDTPVNAMDVTPFGGSPFGGLPAGGEDLSPYGGEGFDTTPGGYDAYGGGYSAGSPYGGGYGGTNSSGFGPDADAAVSAAQTGTDAYGGQVGTGSGYQGGTVGSADSPYGGNAAAVGYEGGGFGFGIGGPGDVSFGGTYEGGDSTTGDAPSGPSDVSPGSDAW